MHKKNIIKYVLIFISLSAVALFISNYQYKNHEQEILNQEKDLLSITYNTIKKSYKIHSEIFFITKINTKDILDLMKKANSTEIDKKNNAREELYSSLSDTYNSMKLFKIKQLHFHLPDNESFLRFHRPNRYGDNLTGIRDTVAYVNKHKVPVSSFEEGRIYNGYRFIYPIIEENRHYGSVEISVSMHEIIQHIKNETISDVEFIIKKNIVQKKVFEDEKKNYAQSKIHKDYFYEKSISNKESALIKTFTDSYPYLGNNINKGSIFNFSTNYNNTIYITTFIPVYNTHSRQYVGNIVITRPNISLEYHHKKNIFINIIIIMFLALLIYAYYRVEKKNQELKKKNKTLNNIQDIAKLGSWELNAKTNKIEWSDEVYKIFGFKPQSFELTYETFLEFIYPKDKIKVDEIFKKSIKLKETYQIQHRIIKSDKSIAYVNQTGHHIYDQKGAYIYTIGTIHDVTSIIEYENKINFIKNELESIANHIPDILFRSKTDDAMTILFVNNAIYKITGYKAQSFILNKVRSYRSIIHPQDRENVYKEIKKALIKNRDYSIEYRILNSIGDVVWVRESGKKGKNDEGMEIVEGIITDITHQKNSIDKLRKFIDIQDSIVILTDTKKIIFANKKFFDFFGYKNLKEFNNNHNCICDMFIKDDTFFHLEKISPKEKDWVKSMLNLPGRERIVSMSSKNNNPHAFSVSINNFDPQIYIINFSDISDTMFEKLQLEKKATRDQLTKAYNRTYFDSSIENIIKNNEKLNGKTGVILLDIDYFKKINDNYGHNTGDEVLKTLVKLLNRLIRKDDVLIRWGGEEFIIILYAKSIENVLKLAEKLRYAIEHHRFANIPSVTCSFGIALHNDDDTIKETINKADQKLYEAKNRGKNIVVS